LFVFFFFVIVQDSQAGEDELRASLSSEAEQAHQSMGMKEIDAQKLSFEVLSKVSLG
jgi:hypothetical protein